MQYGSALAIALAVSSTSLSATAPDALPPAITRVIDCRAVTDKDDRLACYDKQVGALAEATSKTEIVVLDRESTRKARRSLFGLNIGPLPFLGVDDKSPDEILDAIDGTLASVQAQGQGKWLLVLEDGARWVTTEPIIGRDPKVGQTIEIRRGAMGSFRGKIEGGRVFRARRIN